MEGDVEEETFKPGYEKLVQSGTLLERYQYQKVPYPVKHVGKRTKRYKKFKSENHIKRAIFHFQRRVLSTLVMGSPHFVTLTMLDVVSIQEAYRLFTEFGVRLRKEYGEKIIWIIVPEFQERGAVHFHCLIWHLPHDIHLTERDNRRIQNLWAYGFVDIISSDGSPKLSGYLAKYMSKAMHDERLFGQKAYSCSRNALSPVFLTTKTEVAYTKDEFGLDEADSVVKPSREREYETKWLGHARYRAYTVPIEKPPA